MGLEMESPQNSASSSPTSRGRRTPLSLDLSSLPPLTQPSTPSNTLIITNLFDTAIFRADNLLTIQDLINSSTPIHTWSPLKSFRRIIVSFHTTDDAIRIRQLLDGETIMGCRTRVFFGEETPINPVDQHLHLPLSQKLFFISPPPSPPHGWEVREEAAPNKEVHAEDLVTALSKLHATKSASMMHDPPSPISPQEEGGNPAKRQRSGTGTMIYHPEDHGDSPHLPAIAVEDLTESPGDVSPLGKEETIIAHTSRPPVELMVDQ